MLERPSIQTRSRLGIEPKLELLESPASLESKISYGLLHPASPTGTLVPLGLYKVFSPPLSILTATHTCKVTASKSLVFFL